MLRSWFGGALSFASAHSSGTAHSRDDGGGICVSECCSAPTTADILGSSSVLRPGPSSGASSCGTSSCSRDPSACSQEGGFQPCEALLEAEDLASACSNKFMQHQDESCPGDATLMPILADTCTPSARMRRAKAPAEGGPASCAPDSGISSNMQLAQGKPTYQSRTKHLRVVVKVITSVTVL